MRSALSGPLSPWGRVFPALCLASTSLLSRPAPHLWPQLLSQMSAYLSIMLLLRVLQHFRLPQETPSPSLSRVSTSLPRSSPLPGRTERHSGPRTRLAFCLCTASSLGQLPCPLFFLAALLLFEDLWSWPQGGCHLWAWVLPPALSAVHPCIPDGPQPECGSSVCSGPSLSWTCLLE